MQCIDENAEVDFTLTAVSAAQRATAYFGGHVGIGSVTPEAEFEVYTANVVGVVSSDDVGIRLQSADGGGSIYANDMNHAILLRVGQDGVSNTNNYYQYGGTFAENRGHRFYTGGSIEAQTLKFHIADNGALFNVPVTASAAMTMTGDLYVDGNIRATGYKAFYIDNPQTGDKLTHMALEGPEPDVYFRGEHSGSTIDLPNYWDWLVDSDTITVQVTPIDFYQQLFVKKIKNNTIYIKNELKK